MKLNITFKDPDAIFYACEDIEDEEERAATVEKLKEHFRWGEYLDLVYDTETDKLEIVNG